MSTAPTASLCLTVAVVTGGHSFDTKEFHWLFRSIPGVDAYIQSLENWCTAKPPVRASYDVVVFYLMTREGPTDEGLPPHSGKQLTALQELGSEEQGIIVLHHALLAFLKWPNWNELVGIENRKSNYHWNGPVKTEVSDATHPITRGLPASWELNDESYTMNEPSGPNVQVLLTTRHEPSMKTLGWTNRYKNSRVFCYQSGHGAPVYADANFREVLTRAIHWVAKPKA